MVLFANKKRMMRAAMSRRRHPPNRIPRALSKVQKNQVVKLVKKQEQTKVLVQNLVNAQFSQAITTNAEYYTCIPEFTIGTGEGERVGDRIFPQRLNLTGYIGLTAGMTLPCDIYAHLFVLEQKAIQSYNKVDQMSVNFLRGTDEAHPGNTIQFDGNPINAHCVVDNRSFKVTLSKRVRLVSNHRTGFDRFELARLGPFQPRNKE